MKGGRKKKPCGMKHKIREEKKREEHIGLVVIAAILIIVLVSAFFIHSMLSSSSANQETSSTPEPKAAIVDHLSLSRANQTFIDTATNTLKQAGYTVDYYPGEEVTVELYRNLPTHEYSIIILRVHSTLTYGKPPVVIFTSEPYTNTKYTFEQLTDQIVSVAYSVEEAKKGITYFAISPLFVKLNMKGTFANTTIIMMGCEGLNNTKMAEAFIEKGAKVYISWDGSILGSRNDPAITRLLQYLITEKRTVEKAVVDTMKEFGPSPIDNSVLLYYPLEAGDYTIQNFICDITTTIRKIIITNVLKNRKTLQRS